MRSVTQRHTVSPLAPRNATSAQLVEWFQFNAEPHLLAIEKFIADGEKCFPYRLRVEDTKLEVRQFFDPYSFEPVLNEQELQGFNEGRDHRVYEKLGFHEVARSIIYLRKPAGAAER